MAESALDARTARNRDEQRALYGAPLADVVRPVLGTFGISQARLATVLGISAPMLSQLVTAQRVKVGNPAALHRLERLAALAREGSGDQTMLAAALDDVAAMTGDLTRDGDATTAALRRAASPDELRAAADAIAAAHPAIADVLRRAAD